MARPSDSNRAATRWAICIIPLLIFGVFGIAVYAVVYRLCLQYLYRQQGKQGPAAALLTLFVVFFILTLSTYLRILVAIQLDAGLVPLIHGREADEKPHATRPSRGQDPEADAWVPPDPNPDSPGLEDFYTKDVFVCEADGRPKWCSNCRQWKPDRAHHSSELGRCVRKMDHLCPWVGGMVSETSFNFFFQFTVYATCLCAVCIATGVFCLELQNSQGLIPDVWVIVILTVSALFIIFSLAMALTSARFIFTNTTNIDMLKKAQTSFLAVRIPRDTPPTDRFPTIVYPLQLPPTRYTPDGAHSQPRSSVGALPPARDRQATRKFAIVRTEPRENPWNLGFWGNWKSVMGDKAVEWLLPLRHSPCCNHESVESAYQLGPLLAKLKLRYGVPSLTLKEDLGGGAVMHQAGAPRT